MATLNATEQDVVKTASTLVKPVQIFVLSGPPTTTSAAKKVKKMKTKPAPTDIIVFGSKAGHFTGKTVIAAETEENSSKPDKTAVKLSAAKQELIAWRCTKPFSVDDVRPAPNFKYNGKAYKGPNNPFYRDLPFHSTKIGDQHVVLSGPTRADAKHGRFKVVLRFGTKRVDPHIET
jgi:hypothetical protein